MARPSHTFKKVTALPANVERPRVGVFPSFIIVPCVSWSLLNLSPSILQHTKLDVLQEAALQEQAKMEQGLVF